MFEVLHFYFNASVFEYFFSEHNVFSSFFPWKNVFLIKLEI